MKQEFTNEVSIEGRVYSHKLKKGKSENTQSKYFGVEYIKGEVDVAVDEDGINVVKVNFIFVTPTYKSGKANASYNVLDQILSGGKTWSEVGKDNALCVRIQGTVGVEDRYNTRPGVKEEERAFSYKTITGSFINVLSSELELAPEELRSKFKMDMFINQQTHLDANEEKGYVEKLVLKGATFNYNGSTLIPVSIEVQNPIGIQYFENYADQPIFTTVWGKINSINVKVKHEEASIFGDPCITFSNAKDNSWVMTGASEFLEYGEDSQILSPADIEKAVQARNIHLAEVKKNALDYAASKAQQTQPNSFGGPTASSQVTPGLKKFSF